MPFFPKAMSSFPDEIWHYRRMWRTLLLYAIILGIATFILEWVEYQYVMHVFSTEVYIVFIAIGFTALGVWLGSKLVKKPAGAEFVMNDKALRSLNITRREYEVLEFLAAGLANKEIARKMGVSPNTIKTHLGNLYDKLEVQRRTQAIQKAKMLELIP
jgi:DNA-binding CsgD family transcriptional regulator